MNNQLTTEMGQQVASCGAAQTFLGNQATLDKPLRPSQVFLLKLLELDPRLAKTRHRDRLNLLAATIDSRFDPPKIGRLMVGLRALHESERLHTTAFSCTTWDDPDAARAIEVIDALGAQSGWPQKAPAECRTLRTRALRLLGHIAPVPNTVSRRAT
jgi:hypothetical protein